MSDHLCKEDIPEVQHVILLLTPLIEDHWRQIVDRALQDLLHRLSRYRDDLPSANLDFIAREPDVAKRRKAIEDLLFSLLGTLRLRTSTPFDDGLQQLVDRYSLGLLREGASSLSLPFDVASPRNGPLPIAAVEDLAFMVRSRIAQHEDEILQLLTLYLTSQAIRQLSRSPLETVTQFKLSGVPRDLVTWKESVAVALGAKVQTWIPYTVDLWAYRWFSVGAFSSAVENVSQTERIIAQAVLDFKTSKFCRWVNGRTISVRTVEGQMSSYLSAVRRSDLVGAKKAWPLLPSSSGTTEQFEAYAKDGIGLPPYHGHCRTVPVIVRA